MKKSYIIALLLASQPAFAADSTLSVDFSLANHLHKKEAFKDNNGGDVNHALELNVGTNAMLAIETALVEKLSIQKNVTFKDFLPIFSKKSLRENISYAALVLYFLKAYHPSNETKINPFIKPEDLPKEIFAATDIEKIQKEAESFRHYVTIKTIWQAYPKREPLVRNIPLTTAHDDTSLRDQLSSCEKLCVCTIS